jgi:hypothetical protein
VHTISTRWYSLMFFCCSYNPLTFSAQIAFTCWCFYLYWLISSFFTNCIFTIP